MIRYILSVFCICCICICSYGQDSLQYFTASDETKIAYRVEGSGPSVLLIHGFINDGTSWDRTELKAILIEQGYSVIIPDLRGNGKSDKPQNALSYQNNIEITDLIGLITHLNINKYMAIGYSRGSIVLAELLIQDDRISKAVIGGMGADCTDPNWIRRQQFADAFNGVRMHPGTEGAVKYAKSIGADIVALGHQQTYQPIPSVEKLKLVNTPIFIIAGDEDKDNGDPKEFSELFKNAQLKIIEGDHNNSYKTLPFAQSVLTFLKS